MNWDLDFTCMVARMRQVAREGIDNIPDIAERVFTCDLPRMEQYLTNEQWETIREVEA